MAHCARLTLLLAAVCIGLPAAAVGQSLPYQVTVEPVAENRELGAAIESVSNLVSLEGEPPPGPAGLIRRARSDAERLDSVLRSFGHYRGRVSILVAGRPLDDPDLLEALGQLYDTGAVLEPVALTISVAPGPLFTIEEITLQPAVFEPAPSELDGTVSSLPPIDPAILGVSVGDPARAERVLQAERRIVAHLRDQGYPFAEVPSRRTVVDFAADSMRVTYHVAPGPAATLGPVSFVGLASVDEDLVAGRVPFEPGDPYAPARLEALRAALAGLDVFTTIRVTPADRLTNARQLPITVTVQERPPRFVGFGVDFATSEGLGASAFWGHRNLFGGAERLRIEGEVGRLLENDVGDTEYALSAEFQKPDFLMPNQRLIMEAGLTAERTDAFDREAVVASVGVERPLTPVLTVGAGLSFTQQQVTDDGDERDFTLVGIPLSLRLDTTDDILNPTSGIRMAASATPYPTALGSFDNLIVGDVSASTYIDFGTDGDTVLAGRGRLGLLFGPGTLDVPANLRFFAGGGGSVRGFDFQSIGPEDESGDPFGGRSLLTFGLEIRQRVFGDWGIVGFVDGGNVYDTSVPNFEDTLRFGAGVGVRYYTDFGPIRLDIGTALNPEDEDNQPPVSVYISLGQSF